MSVKFTDNSEKYLDESDDAVEAALLACGLQAEGYAKTELGNHPKRIDTGLLKNSITYALGGKGPAIQHYHGDNPSKYNSNSGIPSGSYRGTAPKYKRGKPAVWIGTNVEYAPYVHEGTRHANGRVKMAPNRFIRNAITRNANVYERIVKKYLKKH